jgi:hypothetical protein
MLHCPLIAGADVAVDTAVFAAHDFLVELRSWYAEALQRCAKTKKEGAEPGFGDSSQRLALFNMWKPVRPQIEDLLDGEEEVKILNSFDEAFGNFLSLDLTVESDRLRSTLTSALTIDH